MEEKLVQYLLDDGTLAGLVGEQVRWQFLPQGSDLPAVALHRISGVRNYTNSGPSDLVESRVQIDSWGRTYAEALAVSRAVRARLSGLREQLSGVDFQGAFIDQERHEYDPEAQERVHRVSQDFQIWHSE